MYGNIYLCILTYFKHINTYINALLSCKEIRKHCSEGRSKVSQPLACVFPDSYCVEAVQ